MRKGMFSDKSWLWDTIEKKAAESQCEHAASFIVEAMKRETFADLRLEVIINQIASKSLSGSLTIPEGLSKRSTFF